MAAPRSTRRGGRVSRLPPTQAPPSVTCRSLLQTPSSAPLPKYIAHTIKCTQLGAGGAYRREPGTATRQASARLHTSHARQPVLQLRRGISGRAGVTGIRPLRKEGALHAVVHLACTEEHTSTHTPSRIFATTTSPTMTSWRSRALYFRKI